MKKSYLFCCFLFIFSCQKKEIKLQKPNWLVGKWKRINEKPNKTTFDIWAKNLTGIGFTLQEKDTVFKEFMSIINLKDTLFLKIEGVNKKPTLFQFTSQTDSSFVCENSKNQFPKKITYFYKNKQLKATISNADFSVGFVFEKIK